MKIIQVENQVEGGKVAFELLKEKLAQGAKTLGLATGSSPEGFSKQIVESDLQSYRYFMNQHLFNQKPFKASFLPNGAAKDLEAEVARYNQLLAEYPADLQILGIGTNGHIGFNEPGTSFDSQTHLVDLTPSTIQSNARFFDKMEDVPTQAISMGIGNILNAKSIILFAYGSAKAKAIAGTVEGEVTEELPGSALQKHPDVVIIADKEALSLLKH